jgi:hypothetical protein
MRSPKFKHRIQDYKDGQGGGRGGREGQGGCCSLKMQMQIPDDREQSHVNELRRKLGTVAMALDDIAAQEELIVVAASKHEKTMDACKERAQTNSIFMHQVKNVARTMSDCERLLEAVKAQEVDIARAAEERDAFIESVRKQRAMCIKMAAFISKKPASSSEENDASEEEEALEDEEASVEEEASEEEIIIKIFAVCS